MGDWEKSPTCHQAADTLLGRLGLAPPTPRLRRASQMVGFMSQSVLHVMFAMKRMIVGPRFSLWSQMAVTSKNMPEVCGTPCFLPGVLILSKCGQPKWD